MLTLLLLRNHLDIDYFPSRNNATVDGTTRGPVYSSATVSGKRQKEMIKLEDNFAQASMQTDFGFGKLHGAYD